MLIEQSIEFGLGAWASWPYIYSDKFITACFHDKTKICLENLRGDYYYYLRLKYYRSNVPIPGPNHLQSLAPKCKILTVLWT